MRAVDLELLVRRAIQNRQLNRPIEDDRIEFKRDWPGADKARQFAAAANSLRGEPLVYVIGVDDDGRLHTPASLEPTEWLPLITQGFDSPPPRLLMHRTVAADDDQVVTALVFATDEFPYVMNIRGMDRREVPIRVLSGTQSANRARLLTLLDPITRPPAMTILSATGGATWYNGPRNKRRDDEEAGSADVMVLNLGGKAEVSIAHNSDRPSVLLGRNMAGRVSAGDLVLRVRAWATDSVQHTVDSSGQRQRVTASDFRPPSHGVYVSGGQVVALSTGTFQVEWEATYSEPAPSDRLTEYFEQFKVADQLHIEFAINAIGTDAISRLPAIADRTEPNHATFSSIRADGRNRFQASMGGWEYRQPPPNPWGDA